MEKLAGSLSKVAAVDDEVIQGGANVLLTFTKVRNEAGKGNDIFDRTTKAALDMSAALGGDLQGSVLQLGKALNDPVAGMSALTRSGVSFTEQQKDQIRALAQSGDLLGAQKIILAEVNQEFAGAAAANATATARLAVTAGNLKESLGTALLPAMDLTAGALEGLLGGFTALPGPVQTAAGGLLLLGGGVTAVGLAVGLLGPKLKAARAEMLGMGVAGRGAALSMSILGKATLAVGAFTAVAVGLGAVREKVVQLMGGGPGSLPKLTDAIADFVTTGRVAGELAGRFGTNLEGIGESLRLVGEMQGGWKAIDRLLDPEFSVASDKIDSIDKALAGMVSSGHGPAAAKFFDQIVTSAAAQGVSLDDTKNRFNDYGDALAGTSTQNKLAAAVFTETAGAVADAGEEAAEAKRKWDELRGSLEDVVTSNFSARLASDLTSALNPLERFVAGAGHNIDDLKASVSSATAELAKAKSDLAPLEGTGTSADIARLRGTAGDIDAARARVAEATRRLGTANSELAEAQKSPLASIGENLQSNLNLMQSWLGNMTTLADRGHGELAEHLGALGPQAAGALAEAVGLGDASLRDLEANFDRADQLVKDAPLFHLDLDKAGQPGATLADIIVKRYQESLIPGIGAATQAALDEATKRLLNNPDAGKQDPGAGGRPRGGFDPDERLRVGPALGPVPAGGPLLATQATAGALPGTITFEGGIHVTTLADTDPRQTATELGDHLAWRLGGNQP